MEGGDVGGIGVFNPAKDIAKEVTLQILIRHRDSLQQAREGIIPSDINKDKELSDNEKKINKVRGLYKTIASQREMVNISRPIIRFNCHKEWKKKNDNAEEKDKVKFEDEDNDYNSLMFLKTILEEAELDMVKAEQTQSSKDDYLIEKRNQNGTVFVLTNKYYELLNGLEELYEKIYFMMIKHKIVSTGIEEDDLKTYKELEEEAIKRVVDA